MNAVRKHISQYKGGQLALVDLCLHNGQGRLPSDDIAARPVRAGGLLDQITTLLRPASMVSAHAALGGPHTGDDARPHHLGEGLGWSGKGCPCRYARGETFGRARDRPHGIPRSGNLPRMPRRARLRPSPCPIWPPATNRSPQSHRHLADCQSAGRPLSPSCPYWPGSSPRPA